MHHFMWNNVSLWFQSWYNHNNWLKWLKKNRIQQAKQAHELKLYIKMWKKIIDWYPITRKLYPRIGHEDMN